MSDTPVGRWHHTMQQYLITHTALCINSRPHLPKLHDHAFSLVRCATNKVSSAHRYCFKKAAPRFSFSGQRVPPRFSTNNPFAFLQTVCASSTPSHSVGTDARLAAASGLSRSQDIPCRSPISNHDNNCPPSYFCKAIFYVDISLHTLNHFLHRLQHEPIAMASRLL